MKKRVKKENITKLKISNSNSELFIALRYFCLFLLVLGMYYSSFIYKFFFNLTAYPVSFILSWIQPSTLNDNLLIIGKNIIELIPACIAVSAYVFLLVLNLTTPMNLRIRIKSIIFSFVSLLIINIVRIVILALLFLAGFSSFDIIHKITWYFLSILIVIIIWFSSVKLFKIKNIPVITDFNKLLNQVPI